MEFEKIGYLMNVFLELLWEDDQKAYGIFLMALANEYNNAPFI